MSNGDGWRFGAGVVQGAADIASQKFAGGVAIGRRFTGGRTTTQGAGSLLANRDAIRQQMEEEENLRKQAYWQALLQMGEQANAALGLTTPRFTALPDQIDTGGTVGADPQVAPRPPPPPPIDPTQFMAQQASTRVVLPGAPQDTPYPIPSLSPEALAHPARPGGRAEAFREGRRPKTGSPEDLARWGGPGVGRPEGVNEARHLGLMGEVWDKEKQMMVPTNERSAWQNAKLFGPAVFEGAGDVAFYKTGGALEATRKVLQGASDADARQEGALYDVTSKLTGGMANIAGKLSGVFYGESDKQREEMDKGIYSTIRPDRQIREKPGWKTAGQFTGMLGAEGVTYVGGGFLVKGALRGAGILGPAKKWVANRNKGIMTQWGLRIAESMKQVGTDVLAMAPVDIVTTQRDIDSAAHMVNIFTSPDFLERYREDPEHFLANHPTIDNMANYLNVLASKAVETAAGRAAFEMAVGGIMDAGLRGVFGTFVSEPLRNLVGDARQRSRLRASEVEAYGQQGRMDEMSGLAAQQRELDRAPQLGLEGVDSGIDPTKVGDPLTPTIGPETRLDDSGVPVARRDETQLELEGIIQRTTAEGRLDAIDRAVRSVDPEGRASVTPTGRAVKPRTLLNREARAQLGLKEREVRALGIDPADTEAYSAFLRKQAVSGEAPLTPDIRSTYDGKNNRPSWMKADREQIKELARKGNARDPLWRRVLGMPKTRFWYSEGKAALARLVPDEEFDEFVKFLATFSPNTDPKTNLIEAALNWNRVKRGEPIRGVMPVKKAKAKMVLAGEELDTPKIWSFAENLLGNENAVTVDVWMWRMLEDIQPHKDPNTIAHDGLRYAEAREEIRHIARELTAETGREWTPAQVQAATWVEFRDSWKQAMGGARQGNDDFRDLMEASLTKVAGIERGVREGITEIVAEAMPSQTAPGRPVRMTKGTADVKDRVDYSEARFRVVVPIFRELARLAGFEGKFAGALGVDNPIVKAIRPAQTVESLAKGETLGQGGTWEGNWNSNIPFMLPPNTPPAVVRLFEAVVGDLLEQDVLFTKTFRPNKVEALEAAKDLAGNPNNLDGKHGGVSIVTRKFMGIELADDLATHFDGIVNNPAHPLASALKDVNFTQSGDVLLFTETDKWTGTPQEFWDLIQDSLGEFEGGRFWGEIADKNDMGFARIDGDLRGGSYDSGQWKEQFDDAHEELARLATDADEVSGRIPSDFLESHRDNVRKKFDEIDAEFRERLDGIERKANKVVEDIKAPAESVDSPVDPKKLKEGPPDDGPPSGSGVAGKLYVRPEVAGAAAGLAYGALDPDDPISPLGGAAIGVALTGGGTYLARRFDVANRMSESALTQKVVTRLGGKKEVVSIASDTEVKAALDKITEAETTAGGAQPRPIPEEDLPSVSGPDADDFDANEFVNIGKFGLDPKELERKLEAAVEYVVSITGMDPKTRFTWEQTKAMAATMGLDPDDLAEGLRGQKGRMGESGARLLAARNVIRANTERMGELYKKIDADPTMEMGSLESTLLEREIAVLDGEVNTLLADYMPAMSEAGRVLNAAKIMAQNTMDPAVWVMRATKIVGDPSAVPKDIKIEIARLARTKDKAGLMKLLGQLNKSGIAEQLVTLGKAGMLSGIPTHMMNLLSTATNVFLEEFKDLPADLFDRYLVSTAQATERTKSYGSVRGRLHAAMLGARDGYLNAIEVMKGNPLIGAAEKWDQAKYHINIDLAQRMFGYASEKLAEQTPLLKYVPQIPKVLDAGMQAFHKTVFGALGAGDALLTHFAVRRSLAEQARVQAINSGLKGTKNIEARAALILQNEVTPAMMLEAIAQGELTTFRTRGRVARALTGVKRDLAETSKTPGRLRIPAAITYVGLEKTAPFVQTPINVALRTAEASPGAFAVGALELGYHGGATTIAKVLGLKKAPAYANGSQKRVVEMMGRSTVGGTMIGLGMYLHNQGLLSLGYTPEKQGQRQLTGESENTWRLGDEYISMERLSPSGNLVLLGGYMMRSWQSTGDPDIMDPFGFANPSILERTLGVGPSSLLPGGEKPRYTPGALLEESVEGVGRTLIEQTFAMGVRDLFSSMMQTEREGAEFPISPSSFAQIAVPNIIRRFDRYLDPVRRIRDRPSDHFRQWTPGGSTDLPPRRDPFGEEMRFIPEGTGKLEGFYKAMIDPLATTSSTAENIDGSFNVRAYLQELDVNVSRRRRDPYETPEQFDSRAVQEGRELELGLTTFIASPAFTGVTEELAENEHFQELFRSGHLNDDNRDRLIPALIKAIQAEAISQEIGNIRAAQSERRNAENPDWGGLSQTDIEKRMHQQRLQGRP